MEPRLKALIVDDEYPAREELRFLLRNFPQVEVVGEATNAAEALQLARSLPYAILFLDVRMPGASGLELARQVQDLEDLPWIVFTTAYEEHAFEAFSVNAVDYLLKPFDEKRLARTLDKISMLAAKKDRVLTDALLDTNRLPRDHEGKNSPPKGPAGKDRNGHLGRIPVHKADKTVLINENDIYYAASDDGYVYIKLQDEKLLSRYTLKELEERLWRQNFFRAHRCYLVNLQKVQELIPDFKGAFELVVNDVQKTRIPVSRRRAKRLRRVLGM